MIKYGIAFIFVLSLIQYFYRHNYLTTIELIIVFIAVITFYEYSEKRFIKNYNENKLTKNRKAQKFNGILIEMLYSYIEDEGLNSKDGIEYLIKIYSKKSRTKKFRLYAVVAVFTSAIVNNFFYVVFMGGNTDWMRLYTYFLTIKLNLILIVNLVLIIAFYSIVIKRSVKDFLKIYNLLWGEKYNSLVEILEYQLLPIVLRDKKENTDLQKSILDIDFGLDDGYV